MGILVGLSVIVPFFTDWKKSPADEVLLVLCSGVIAYAGRFLWPDKVVTESDGSNTETAEIANVSIPAYIIVAVFLVVYVILVVRVILAG